jgi:hypothetical protein
VPAVLQIATDADMRDLGRRLARLLRAGDLVILAGPLGAGKTTLVQGIGDGLGVRGPVTSPTRMPTGWAASTRSTTWIWTPTRRPRSRWWSGAPAWPRCWPRTAWRSLFSPTWTPMSGPFGSMVMALVGMRSASAREIVYSSAVIGALFAYRAVTHRTPIPEARPCPSRNSGRLADPSTRLVLAGRPGPPTRSTPMTRTSRRGLICRRSARPARAAPAPSPRAPRAPALVLALAPPRAPAASTRVPRPLPPPAARTRVPTLVLGRAARTRVPILVLGRAARTRVPILVLGRAARTRVVARLAMAASLRIPALAGQVRSISTRLPIPARPPPAATRRRVIRSRARPAMSRHRGGPGVSRAGGRWRRRPASAAAGWSWRAVWSWWSPP